MVRKQFISMMNLMDAYPQVLKLLQLMDKTLKTAQPQDRIQQFIFDSMGRLEQRTVGYGHHGLKLEQQQTEEFAYDFMGRLLQAKNAESNLQWF